MVYFPVYHLLKYGTFPSSQKSIFEILPKDIISKIFSELEIRDLKNVSLVNKQAYKLIHYDSVFWANYLKAATIAKLKTNEQFDFFVYCVNWYSKISKLPPSTFSEFYSATEAKGIIHQNSLAALFCSLFEKTVFDFTGDHEEAVTCFTRLNIKIENLSEENQSRLLRCLEKFYPHYGYSLGKLCDKFQIPAARFAVKLARLYIQLQSKRFFPSPKIREIFNPSNANLLKDEADRIQLAKEFALNKSYDLPGDISLCKITDQKALIKIVKLCQKKMPYSHVEIDEFGIQSEVERAKIAKSEIRRDTTWGFGDSRHGAPDFYEIKSYQITNQELRNELALNDSFFRPGSDICAYDSKFERYNLSLAWKIKTCSVTVFSCLCCSVFGCLPAIACCAKKMNEESDDEDQ